MSEEIGFQSFQHQVASLLIRHRSFLDASSKLTESNARVNRAVMKAVTDCGCIEVQANRQPYEPETSFESMKEEFHSHLSGGLCEHCSDVIKQEMGKNIFYLTALCNLLAIDLQDVIQQESNKLSTLGIFSLR